MKETVYLEMSNITNATGAATLESNPLRPGLLMCIQHIAVMTDSGDNAVAHVRIKYPRATYYVTSVAMPVGGNIYCWDGTIFIGSDAVVQVIINNAASNAVVVANIFGYQTSVQDT